MRKRGLYSVTVIEKLYKEPEVFHVGQYIAHSRTSAERQARKGAGVGYEPGFTCVTRQLPWNHRMAR